jgi:hemoglobin-like flavoprotein
MSRDQHLPRDQQAIVHQHLAAGGRMTPEQITLVQLSFKDVAAIASKASDLFYDRLFEIAPNVRALFPKLIGMLATAINNLHQLDAILPTVHDLGNRHRGYGVTVEHYASVGAALLWTLEQGLGSKFTQDVKLAWGEAYSTLASAMQDHQSSEMRGIVSGPENAVAAKSIV